MAEKLNIYIVYDTTINCYDRYNDKICYDSEFIKWLVNYLNNKYQNYQKNIIFRSILMNEEANDGDKIKNTMIKHISYDEDDENSLLHRTYLEKILSEINRNIWNSECESKNIVLIFTENYNIIANINIIKKYRSYKNINDFTFASIGYIVKSYYGYYLIDYKNIKSKTPTFLIRNMEKNYFLDKFDIFINNLLENIEYKQKNAPLL